MGKITHIVTDSSRETVYATGDNCDQAIRNLDDTYSPGDFGCETWDEVVDEWNKSEDGLGDLMVVLASDHPELEPHAP